MSLIFTKNFFRDGDNDFGAYFDGNGDNDDYEWLAYFLMDDGGSGVHHLLTMSEELLQEIIEKVPNGEEVEQYRAHLGAIVNAEETKIDSMLVDEIVSVMPTEFFVKKLKECIDFIKKNY